MGFVQLLQHKGHQIEIATYEKDGHVFNVAVECEDCCQVLIDFNNPVTKGEIENEEKRKRGLFINLFGLGRQ